MLIGVLCEVVQATAEGEKKKLAAQQIQEVLGRIFQQMDENGNGTLSNKEFLDLARNQEVKDALETMEIMPFHIEMISQVLFTEKIREDGKTYMPELSFSVFLETLMKLRPGIS